MVRVRTALHAAAVLIVLAAVERQRLHPGHLLVVVAAAVCRRERVHLFRTRIVSGRTGIIGVFERLVVVGNVVLAALVVRPRRVVVAVVVGHAAVHEVPAGVAEHHARALVSDDAGRPAH